MSAVAPVPALLALPLAALAIVLARRLALATGLVAKPNPIVRAHRAPVPYLGGAAVVGSWALLVLVSPRLGVSPLAPGTLARVAAAIALAAIGTWDDARPLTPRAKLAAQAVVTVGYLAAVHAPLAPASVADAAILVLLTNAFNVIDVMDGLLALVTAIGAGALLLLPGIAAGPLANELVIALGSVAALFAFNRPPAAVFAGDAGSLPLGFLVGATALAARGPHVPLHLALLGAAAVPLFEVSLLVPARLARGRSPLRGSPDHFALRLQDQRGWGKWRVLGATALAGGACALSAALAARLPTPFATALVAGTLVALVLPWIALWRIPPPTAIRDDAARSVAERLPERGSDDHRGR